MRKSYLLSLAVLLVGCTFVAATTIPLVNPSFEDPGLIKIKGWNGDGTPAIDIPGWAANGVAVDSGVETGWTPTDGDWTAFLMSGDPSIWQLTSFVITGGEIIQLQVDSRITWIATTLRMTLYCDANGVRVPLAAKDVSITGTMATYSMTYNTADSPASIGKKLGVELSNATAAASTYLGLDNVRLSYTLEPVKPPVASLTHSYTFEDGTARDVVGDANGTLVGGAKVEGGALVTSAQGDYMSMPGDKIDVNSYSEVTIEAWYTPVNNGNTSWSMLAYFGDSTNGVGSNGFFMTSARGDNVSRAAISCGNLTAPYAVESGANGTEYDDGLLHHMVATIDANNIALYIDGALSATTPLSATNKLSLVSNNLAWLAKGGYTGDPTWIGQIHEFNIYNKAMTLNEVMWLHGARPTPEDPGVNGLMAWYPLDGDANDHSVNARVSTVAGTPTYVEGMVNLGLNLKGSPDAVDTKYAENLATWTISCWVKGTRAPISGGPSGVVHREKNYQFNWDHTDVNFRGAIGVNTANGWWGASLGALVGNTWYHVAGTYDGEDLKAYKNGELISTNSSPTGVPNAETNSLKIGRHATSTSTARYFAGVVDEVMVYNKALTVNEVRYIAGFRVEAAQ